MGALDERIEQFIESSYAADDELFHFYESHTAGFSLCTLVIRQIEAVITLGNEDAVLFPAACCNARVAIETGLKAAWMLKPEDVFEREARFLAFLRTEDQYLDRTHKYTLDQSPQSVQSVADVFKEHADHVRHFRKAVEERLPAHVDVPKALPNARDLFKSIGSERAYALYMYLCQYTHSTHFAFNLISSGLGTKKSIGEKVQISDWALPIWCAHLALKVAGNSWLQRVNATETDFYLEPAVPLEEINRVLEA